MKKIDIYILNQFLNLLLISILGFIILFVLVDYVENIDKFIDSKIPINSIINYYFYSIPWFISIGLPMSMLVSTIFTIGLLLKRNELTAMKAAGVSLYRIATPIVILSIIISISGFYFDNFLVTYGNKKCKEIETKFAMKSRNSTFSLKKKNIFLSKANQSQIAIDKYSAKTNIASGVAIQYMKNGKLNKRIDAHKMTWDNKLKKWVLNAYAIRIFNNQGFENKVFISRNDTIIETGYIPDDLAKEAIAPQEKNYADLKVFIKELNQSGIETTRWEVNLHAKLAFSFINMIVVLFAIPLVAFRPSTELAFGAGISVFLIFAYYAFIRFGVTLGYKDILNPLLSAWFGNIIFSSGGLILMILAKK
mgnify:FL=1|tara:strand:- start:44166 stop:45257 length:1092 start_codon:yes stop_codon:yes gene_type:complete